jgi:hypothetical protein
MTVSAINGSSNQWPTQTAAPPLPPPMTNTAQLLGLSTSRLSQDLQSGTTLNTLASQQGVSSSSLISSIESDLKANAPQGAPALSTSQLNQMAGDIASGTRPAGHHHHHHGGGGFTQLIDPTQSPASSSDPLTQALQSASADSSLASQDNAQTQDGTVAGTATSARAQSNLSALAGLLGTDPSTLIAQLSSGTDLSSMLSTGAGTGYGTSIANSNTGGIAVDEYA